MSESIKATRATVAIL